jgi:hypothetical protein
MANHEVYVVQGKTLDNIAGTMRAVLGVDKDTPIRFDEVASSDKTEQINTDVETQTDLIAQIKTALEGKAGASGDEVVAQIASLIDQSGVLGTTEETVTVTKKVEQLIDKMKLFVCTESFYVGSNYQKESIDFYIDLPYVVQMPGLLVNNKYVKRMVGVNTSIVKGFSQAFMNSVIEEIERPFNFSGITNKNNINTAFRNAHHLREVRFEQQTLKYDIYFSSEFLSADSVQSIFGGLNSEVTGQTLTLPKEFKNADGTTNTEAEAVVTANIEEVDGVMRIKGKKGWTLVR